MKNQKLKTGLTAIAIIAIFVTLILMLISVLTENGAAEDPMFYKWEGTADAQWTGHYDLDWNYAGIYFVLLLVALGAWITKLVMFTVPSVKDKDNHASVLLLCDMLVLIGVIFAILGLFLPVKMDIDASTYNVDDEPARLTGARILNMMGTPLAFISALGTVGLTFKNK